MSSAVFKIGKPQRIISWYYLEYYGALREAARRGALGAEAEFNELRPFFRRARPKAAEPTEAEIERDLHALLHGTKT